MMIAMFSRLLRMTAMIVVPVIRGRVGVGDVGIVRSPAIVTMFVHGHDHLSRAIAEVANPSTEREQTRQRHDGDGGGEPLGEGRVHDEGNAPGNDLELQAVFA